MPIVHIPVAMPENTSTSEMRRIAKAVHEYGKKLAGMKTDKESKSLDRKSAHSALGSSEAEAHADHLSTMLESAEPDPDEIYQAIIQYRKNARKLPAETRAIIDRRIAQYSNSQVSSKSAKRK